MNHKTNVNLSAGWRIQVLFNNLLITKINEMLNPPTGGQHDVQRCYMTQCGHS